MVPDASSPTRADDATSGNGSSTAFNALIGGIAGVILSFIPLSTILGGAIAGYLESGGSEDGLKVGAIAGLVMLIPFVFFGFFLLFILGVAGTPAAFGLLGLLALFFAALYTVGLGALGGVLGVYLKDEL
ncbi:DUF5518 domain-containing protein [Natronococcus wangiae]|uniref:DUF5518 domain-containing protein n=1 Tax=Natronococcus wangiae TaxID=3068275 RepID=UPI00273D32ED|nr:DUF5518 domain-containing protein [Natronococcus sp. AD5]